MIKHEQWVWKPPRSMIKSAEASGADKSKLESSAVLRKVQRDFRMMTLDRPGEKPMHLQAWPSVLKKERKHAQMMAELLGKEVAPEKQLEEMRRKMCSLSVENELELDVVAAMAPRRCCTASTSSTRPHESRRVSREGRVATPSFRAGEKRPGRPSAASGRIRMKRPARSTCVVMRGSSTRGGASSIDLAFLF